MLCKQSAYVSLGMDELAGLESMAHRMAETYKDAGMMMHFEIYQAIETTAHIFQSMELKAPKDFCTVFERLYFENEFTEEL